MGKCQGYWLYQIHTLNMSNNDFELNGALYTSLCCMLVDGIDSKNHLRKMKEQVTCPRGFAWGPFDWKPENKDGPESKWKPLISNEWAAPPGKSWLSKTRTSCWYLAKSPAQHNPPIPLPITTTSASAFPAPEIPSSHTIWFLEKLKISASFKHRERPGNGVVLFCLREKEPFEDVADVLDLVLECEGGWKKCSEFGNEDIAKLT